MVISPDTVEVIKTLTPVALGFIGVVFTVISGIVGAVGKQLWKLHERRMASVADCLGKLAKAVDDDQERLRGEHSRMWEAIQGLRAELQLSNKNSDTIKSGMLKLEGAIDNQRLTMYQHVERLGKIDSKLEAVFRFIDAPRRGTDFGG